MRWRPLSRKAWVPMADVKCVLIHDNFQNFKSYNIPKAQLVIADIPYNIGMDFYASRPDWYVDGDNKNGESDKARKAAFNTDFTFNICSYSLLSEHLLCGFLVEISGHFKSVAVASQLSGSPKCRTTAGARVNDHIALISKGFDQAFQHGHRFLGRMDLRIFFAVPLPVKPVEDHVGLAVFSEVTELRQLVPVQHQSVFRCTHDLHVGFQDLRTVVLAEHQRDIILEAVLLRFSDHLRDLLESTENDHARRIFLAFSRLFLEQPVAEMEIFCKNRIRL